MKFFDALDDFLTSFQIWRSHRETIGEDQDSWTYEQGNEEACLYQTMLAYWEVLNEIYSNC